MIRGISKMEYIIEANMWERARMWEDLAKHIKGEGWVHSISAWLNGPSDVHDCTLDRRGMAMRHVIKPINVKPRKPKPPASAFHQ
jgi:hypothetical protein